MADAETVEVRDSRGATRTVRAAGIEVPTGADCLGAESTAWAAGILVGQQVSFESDTAAEFVTVILADGTDYATNAVSAGYAKALAAAPTALRTAEAAARSAGTGLWGPPCHGSSTVAKPVPAATTAPRVTTAKPTPQPKVTTTAPQPRPTTEEAPTADQRAGAYYKNCTAARKAGAAPLHRGDPGYAPKLDRDNDGIACE